MSKNYVTESQDIEFDYNHGKAAKIRESLDSSGEIYKDISNRIKQYTMLPGFANREGAKISYGNFPYNGTSKNMAEKIVTAAEIIRECLRDDGIKLQMVDSNKYLTGKDEENIFGVVLGNLFYGLKGIREEDLSDIMGAVGNIYDVEEV